MAGRDVTFGVHKQGYMEKLGARHKALKRRWVVLLDDKIVYSKAPDSDRPQGTVALADVTEVCAATAYDIGRHRALQVCTNCWKIATPRRTFFLVADTRSEMTAWIEHIQAVLRNRTPAADTDADIVPL